MKTIMAANALLVAMILAGLASAVSGRWLEGALNLLLVGAVAAAGRQLVLRHAQRHQPARVHLPSAFWYRRPVKLRRAAHFL